MKQTAVPSRRPIVLVLFPLPFDEQALARLEPAWPQFEFVRIGFDLFRFPQNLRLLSFDIDRFVEQLLKRFRSREIAAVISTHDQFGALAAALLANRLGLPGTPVQALLRAQNKAAARMVHREVLPQHTPEFCTFRYDADPQTAITLPYPVFVKPVKAAFSVLARRCHSPNELAQLLELNPWERFIIRALTRPFRQLSQRLLPEVPDADHFIAETALEPGWQVCVDGYAEHGCITMLEVVDSLMYPGTQAFRRFELPSRLPAPVRERAIALATQAAAALGLTHGLFNVELIWHPDTDRLWIVEVNPRMAGQFNDLYERVHGRSLWDIQLALALGSAVPAAPGGRYGAAASFVYREFGAAVKHPPSRDVLDWLVEHAPDAMLYLDLKFGSSRRREQKWVGSYRYALLHLGGADHEDLRVRFEAIDRKLEFDRAPERNTARLAQWIARCERAL
ncbi:MAG: ATP-grasp domain-containing protein [Casimicrobiaceae bacterium]|nr:ATP-grasp domain-containing protein [Casimicrobiaceae bacterium]